MARYKVSFYGGKRITTVAADSHQEARLRVAKARDLDPSDLQVDEIRERADITCSKCGWQYKGRPAIIGAGSERCVVCEQEVVVWRRQQDWRAAQEKLMRLRLARAAQKARLTSQTASGKE